MSNNLHRSEAQQRARTVRHVGYRVALDVAVGAEHSLSTTSVQFHAERGAETFIDLVADRVLEVELNGSHLDPRTVFDGFRIRLRGLAQHNVLKVVAECFYSSTGKGCIGSSRFCAVRHGMR